MEEIDIINKLAEVSNETQLQMFFGNNDKMQKIAEHKVWLNSIRKEHPSPNKKYNIGIYIRFFNQTKYPDYLDYHKAEFERTIALCPNWTLKGFYIDEGSSPPKAKNAPEWSRLLNDASEGLIDLIITQKVSNVTKNPWEITLISKFLASLEHPVGIYFVSEDIFTLASYYVNDRKDAEYFLPEDWELLPDDEKTELLTDD